MNLIIKKLKMNSKHKNLIGIDYFSFVNHSIEFRLFHFFLKIGDIGTLMIGIQLDGGLAIRPINLIDPDSMH